jgi:bile acid:Na+ symporter, BASS family
MSGMSLTFIDFLVSGVLAAIMFGVGLSINLGDLREIRRSPRAFFYGLFAQMVLLPVIALLITYFTNLPPAIKTGFIILAACPGGTTSGLVNVFFRGNVALSVALTTINSILTLFTIPLLVNLGLTIYFGRHSIFQLPFMETFLQIFFITLLPATIGVFVRLKWDSLAEKIQKPVRNTLLILFAGVYVLVTFTDKAKGGSGIMFSDAVQIFPYALLINAVGFLAGLLMGKIGKTGLRSAFTMGIEVALQNTTLALLVGGTLIRDNEMVKPALVYALFSFWTALLYGIIIKKYNKASLFGEFK